MLFFLNKYIINVISSILTVLSIYFVEYNCSIMVELLDGIERWTLGTQGRTFSVGGLRLHKGSQIRLNEGSSIRLHRGYRLRSWIKFHCGFRI